MKNSEDEHREFERMLRRSRSTIYRMCLAFTDRRPDNVDDLFQEIACNLWRSWHRFRGECATNTWVYRIALNTAISDTRRRRRRGHKGFVPLDDLQCADLAEEAADPQLERLYDLIDRLSDNEKQIIYLYLDRLSYLEIAEITGISEASVRQGLHRIRQRLIEIKQQYEYEEYI